MRKIFLMVLYYAALFAILSVISTSCGLLNKKHLQHESKVFERVVHRDTVRVRVDSMHTDTVRLPGELVWLDCDSVVASSPALLPGEKGAKKRHVVQVYGEDNPNVELIYDTIYQTKEVWVENVAALRLKDDSIVKLRKALRQAQDDSKRKVNSGWRLAALILAVLLIIFFKLKRK